MAGSTSLISLTAGEEAPCLAAPALSLPLRPCSARRDDRSREGECVERWITDAFPSYVGDLQAAVDRQLEASVGEQAREAEDALPWVTHSERRFWDMAMSG
jgi:hypothetical protein